MNVFTIDNLNRQGFGDLDDEEKSRYAWSLRFSPGIAAIIIMVGLVLQSPIIIGAMALVALSGALFPRGMFFDLIYNIGVRHILNAPPLPATPIPRRFSYLLSTSLLTGSALSFLFGLNVLGIVLGAMVAIGASILTTTLWCLGSWYYNLFFRNHSKGPDITK